MDFHAYLKPQIFITKTRGLPPDADEQSLRCQFSLVAKVMRRSARAALARWFAGCQATVSQIALGSKELGCKHDYHDRPSAESA